MGTCEKDVDVRDPFGTKLKNLKTSITLPNGRETSITKSPTGGGLYVRIPNEVGATGFDQYGDKANICDI